MVKSTVRTEPSRQLEIIKPPGSRATVAATLLGPRVETDSEQRVQASLGWSGVGRTNSFVSNGNC
jgi:purine nucleoside phosphorylase